MLSGLGYDGRNGLTGAENGIGLDDGVADGSR